jgi:hypothetical protein
MKELNISPLVISDHNFSLTKSGFTLDDYLIFRSGNKSELESGVENEINEETIKVE